MKRLLMECTCQACGIMVKVPDTYVPTYEDLLLRNIHNNHRLALLTVDDPIWDEFREILNSHTDLLSFSIDKQRVVIQKLFGIATCDPDEDGYPFEVGKLPHCPICKVSETLNRKETNPPEYVELEVPDVTHARWNTLSLKNKIERVRSLSLSIFGDSLKWRGIEDNAEN